MASVSELRWHDVHSLGMHERDPLLPAIRGRESVLADVRLLGQHALLVLVL
ncbi:MAG: hypothetical protein ACXW1Y_03015 [Acidimicrobiia bacterium]